ncbi:MAG: hydantoinase B/oxoprolinase family protein [Candidatus Bathyarchaeia archaeon]|jgi:N-methylhydantoinase B
MSEIDPVTLSILMNKLTSISEEMNLYLVKASYSTNIKDRRDSSTAIYKVDGDMLAQGAFVPVHLGVMPIALKEVLQEVHLDSMRAGDVIIHNDGYKGGTHLNDIILYKPIFYKSKPIAIAGTCAHHPDVGGTPDALSEGSIFSEGIRLSAIKLFRAGELQDDVMRIISTNVRTPQIVKGDILAQCAANNRCEERILQLAGEYGAEMTLQYFDELLDYSERGMRSAISKLPSMETEFEDFSDFDGVNFRKDLFKIRPKIRIVGDEVYVSFEDPPPPGAGGVNSPWSLTLSACYYAIKAVVGPTVPTNGGAYRPIHVIKPEKESMLCAQLPHAVRGCTSEPAERIVDAIIGAFSKILPERVCACDGHWPSASFLGIDPKTGEFFAYIETYGGGRGAKYNDDGADAHHTHMTNTRNAEVEIIESEYPLRVDAYRIVSDTGGPGRFRGGCAMRREFTILANEIQSSADVYRTLTGPYGLFGGKPGGTAKCGIIFPDGEEICGHYLNNSVPASSKMYIQSNGGGGYGDPLTRDSEKVMWDVLNEYVSLKAAKEEYGVLIDSRNFQVDFAATEAERKRLREPSEILTPTKT